MKQINKKIILTENPLVSQMFRDYKGLETLPLKGKTLTATWLTETGKLSVRLDDLEGIPEIEPGCKPTGGWLHVEEGQYTHVEP